MYAIIPCIKYSSKPRNPIWNTVPKVRTKQKCGKFERVLRSMSNKCCCTHTYAYHMEQFLLWALWLCWNAQFKVKHLIAFSTLRSTDTLTSVFCHRLLLFIGRYFSFTSRTATCEWTTFTEHILSLFHVFTCLLLVVVPMFTYCGLLPPTLYFLIFIPFFGLGKTKSHSTKHFILNFEFNRNSAEKNTLDILKNIVNLNNYNRFVVVGGDVDIATVWHSRYNAYNFIESLYEIYVNAFMAWARCGKAPFLLCF